MKRTTTIRWIGDWKLRSPSGSGRGIDLEFRVPKLLTQALFHRKTVRILSTMGAMGLAGTFS
jgi:hypothetical protein